MDRLTNGEKTELAYEMYFCFDFENPDDDLPGKEYIDSFNESNFFLEGIKKYILLNGYNDDLDDSKKLIDFLSKLVKNANIDISRQNITNWVNGVTPALNTSARENIYKLCFAFKMDEQQVCEFFIKYYLERPFNFRNLVESVYYYCFKNGKTYSDAIRIIEQIKADSETSEEKTDVMTEYIYLDLKKISNENELINYLSKNIALFEGQSRTATQKIEELLELNKKIVERMYVHFGKKTAKKITIDALLSEMYGYSARSTQGVDRATKQGKKVFDKSISKSAFPLAIKRNFPQRQEFQRISDGTASYETIRKALIMLEFYNFFAEDYLSGEYNCNRFDDFVDELDKLLYECGYIQLYWRNPYDWMIGYCAAGEYPLDTLKELIDVYYLNDNV